MASTCSVVTLPRAIIGCNTRSSTPNEKHISKCSPVGIPGRRQTLLLLTATIALKAVELPSLAQDIPLFGLRKKLKKVEEEAEEIVKEGFQAADKGIEAAEKGVVAVEKGLETAEEEISSSVNFAGLAQAGAVAGAEVIGVLVATSIVNGILGPEAQKS